MCVGLPCVGPTAERVEAMLTGTTRDPLELLGKCPPNYGEVTVENVCLFFSPSPPPSHCCDGDTAAFRSKPNFVSVDHYIRGSFVRKSTILSPCGLYCDADSLGWLTPSYTLSSRIILSSCGYACRPTVLPNPPCRMCPPRGVDPADLALSRLRCRMIVRHNT